MSDQVISTKTVADHAIPVTQYLRPGRIKQRIYWHTHSETLANKAQSIIKRGFVFEMEVLRTGEVSMTVTDPAPDGSDIAVEVANNESGKTDAGMEALIGRAHEMVMRRAS